MEVNVQSPVTTEAAPPTRRKLIWGSLPGGVRYLIVLAVLVLIWQTYVSLGQVPQLLVASPIDVARALGTDIANGQLPQATISTLKNLIIGMVIGMVIGFAFASLAVFSRLGQDMLSVLTSILNPLPSIAILPLAMIWFGLTPTAIIFVIAQATIWPIAINTDTGFRTISATTHMVARNLGLRGPRMVLDVLLPAAMPHILSGLKAAWAFGWRTVVAAELVFGVAGSAGGLGWYINDARYYLETPNIFAGLVVISILGILVDMLFNVVERATVVRWGMKQASS